MREAAMATSLAHLSPQRLPTEPGSTISEGLPELPSNYMFHPTCLPRCCFALRSVLPCCHCLPPLLAAHRFGLALARNFVAAWVAVLDYLVFAFLLVTCHSCPFILYRTATAWQDLIGSGPIVALSVSQWALAVLSCPLLAFCAIAPSLCYLIVVVLPLFHTSAHWWATTTASKIARTATYLPLGC